MKRFWKSRRSAVVTWLAGVFLLVMGLSSGSSDAQAQGSVASYTSGLPRFVVADAVIPHHYGFSAFESPPDESPATPASHLSLSNKEMNVPIGVRVMVFAPHPDDESLAAGGLMQRVLQRDGKVRVVFVTNGDGYVAALRKEFQGVGLTSEDFIEYGERRHEEAVHAISELGLQPSDGIFLGFPDDGVDDLWAGYWSARRPYVSPHTHFDHPKYKEVLSQKVKYTGVDLKNEIARTIRDFMPDWIIIPDPRDTHPDHCATGAFVLDALRKLRQEHGATFDRMEAYTYLVHYYDYPSSVAWARQIKKAGFGGSGASTGLLASAKWLNLPLTLEEVATKQRALLAHETQQEFLHDFMEQFLIPYELFGRLNQAQIMSAPLDYASHFRRPNS